MLTTAVDLPLIRRLEAVSFRSLPSTSTFFNGSWAVRLTQALPAKRLNSINPLDPRDSANLETRIASEMERFRRVDREMVFRLSPLAANDLAQYLQSSNWTSFDPSIVMILNLDQMQMDQTIDRLPFKDVQIWVDEVLELGNQNSDKKLGNVDLIRSIESNTGLFLLRDKNEFPLCALRVVIENDLVGLFSLVTSTVKKRQGFASSLLSSALSWARQQGANTAWLQVESANTPAIALYKKFGFHKAYEYIYVRPPKQD